MKERFKAYLSKHGYDKFDLKAVLFDMDGVLYDSMKWHSKSWFEIISKRGIECTPEEFFLYEGRTGHNTINILFNRAYGRDATEEEKAEVYKQKSDLFVKYNTGETIPYAQEVVKAVKDAGLKCILVTGSGQYSLLNKLAESFPDTFNEDLMVTAHNVTKGKPHPEPYLMGLERGGNLKPNQAIVIENAPMGVESGSAANIFTIAVNTGPIADSILWDAGADIVLPSMQALSENLGDFLKELGR